jgi:hypothetical protein
LNSGDRFFWTTLRRLWSRWADVLLIVKPDTVVGWHRAGFRLYWRWRSRPRVGRPRITQELRDLIGRLARENSDWGFPKIHAELQKLGFSIAERSVARYLLKCISAGGRADAEWRELRRRTRDGRRETLEDRRLDHSKAK